MTLLFTKMHGLGNDFVVIDATKKPFHVTPDRIRLLADRNRGVGCDQVLIVGTATQSGADFSYHIYNADGSEAYQFGNGARCVGLFVQAKKLSDKKIIGLETRRDLIFVEHISGDRVRVDMGKPNFDPPSLPFIPPQLTAPYQLQLTHHSIEFDVVSIGNPHCVITSQDFSTDQINTIGRELNSHKAFPEGVNVGFVTVHSRDAIMLCVYERGAGLTQACGSGACAAVAVGRHRNALNAQVVVNQAGGMLEVNWESTEAIMQLVGPAVFVFDGEFR